MKNKLALTALAIAIAAPGVATAAEVKFSGIIQVNTFLDNGVDDDVQITGGDIRIQLDASEEINGYKGFATYRIDADALAGQTSTSDISTTDGSSVSEGEVELTQGLTPDSILVGVGGAGWNFGWGEVPNAENSAQRANDIHDFHPDTEQHWGLWGSVSGVNYSVNYSPEENADEFLVGADTTFGPLTVGATVAAYGGENGKPEGDGYVLGATLDLGVVSIDAHYSEEEFDNGTDFEDVAIRFNTEFANWAVSVTYSDAEEVDGDGNGTDRFGDNGEAFRIDAGTTLVGSTGLGIRYQNKEFDNDSISDDDFLRLTLETTF